MRNAAFLAVGLVLILAQGNLYRVLGRLGIHGITPSLVLPLVIFLGVHEASMARGALLAFAFGYLTDLFAGAPVGLFTFVSVAIWGLSRMAGVRLTAQTVITQVALGGGFALVESAIVLTLLAIFGNDAHRPVEIASVVLPHAAATALFSPFGFRIAQRVHASGLQAAARAAQEVPTR